MGNFEGLIDTSRIVGDAYDTNEVIATLPSPVALFDTNGELVAYSPACCAVFNTRSDEDTRTALRAHFVQATSMEAEQHMFSAPDSEFHTIRDGESTLVSFIPTDPATNLLTRTRLFDKVTQVLDTSAINGAHLLCITFEKFRDFKAEVGEQAGDRLLMKIANRMAGILPNNSFAARAGGSSFAILILNDANRSACEKFNNMAEQIKAMLSRPYLVDSQVAEINASIGWAKAENNVNTLELMRRAELSLTVNSEMPESKDQPYSATMDEKLKDERKLEFDLRKALMLDEFELHYQMQLDYTNRKISGFEALIRWCHAERGMVFPDVFIPLAERSGLIVPMGEWVIKTACKEAMLWPESIRVAVNVSPVQLQSDNLIPVVKQALAETGLSPDRLEIEITESTAIQDESTSRQRLLELKALGLSIALDDFGTGYASLSYLRSFPFDKLKIDQSFIRSDDNRVENDLVLQSMFSLGKVFGMTTLAEGIETEEHQEKLLNLGCDKAQGYLYSRPVPFPKTFELISRFNQISVEEKSLPSRVQSVVEKSDVGDSGLFQIAYISDNSVASDTAELEAMIENIQADSSKNNTADNISGALMFNQLCFAQILEGESHIIENTFERIQNDPRHHNIQVLDYGPIKHRSFPDWAMAFVGETASNSEEFDKLALLSGSTGNTDRSKSLQQILLQLVERNSVSLKAA